MSAAADPLDLDAPEAAGRVARAGRIPPIWRRVVLGLLVVAFLVVGLRQASQDAPTVDEGVDLSSGVTSLVRHDLRLVPEHPALPKALAALPALFAHPKVPKTAAYREGRWFDYSDDFISANAAAGRLHPMLMWARSVLLLEAVGCAALLYFLTRRSFGPDGGLLAAVAWLTTPYVVGLSHFAMIDIPFTLVTLGTCLVLARWRDDPSVRRTLALGLVLGTALASRHTGLVLVVVAFAVIAHRHRAVRREAVRAVAISGIVAVLVVWLVYRGIAPSTPTSVAAGQVPEQGVVAKLVHLLPLPWEWRAGFSFLSLTSTDRPSSLFGQSWDGGRIWYFPASAALKLPFTLVLAIVAGWVVAVRTRAAALVDRLELALVVALPGVALWVFLVLQPLNLGLRLAMPVVALAYVGLGALPGLLASRGTGSVGPRVVAGALVVVLAVQLASSVTAASHPLAWTPWPWHPSYQWVSDSNLDAGQGLYEVRRWARTHDHPFVAVDTTRGLAVEGGSRSMTKVPARRIHGWVAVGVTPLMQTRRDDLAWLRKYCPVDTLAGGSILVYRFVGVPDASPGPERPVDPCFGAAASRVR